MNNTPISQELFSEIKTLLKFGLTQKAIGEKLGYHVNTIYLINSAKDWEDYKRIKKERTEQSSSLSRS